jgi:CRP/FNR family transcriptional regulator
MNKNSLLAHMLKFVSLDEEEQQTVLSFITLETFKKKAFLLKEKQTCHALYFVQKGCLRNFFINEKGVEHTTQFAIENWWITDFMSLDRQTPSHFYIQAVENSEVYILTKTKQEELFNKVPQTERYFRIITQKTYGAFQLRIKYLYSQSGEERYHHFNNLFPEFVQRVPQYMLASYLGFTPEFLSKIRARK